MKQTAENILKKALLEAMEQEAGKVPRDEQIRSRHIFSRRFLNNMKPVLEEGEKVEKSEGQNKTGKVKKGIIYSIFYKKKQIAAACIVCVLAAGTAWVTWSNTFGGKVGSADSAGAAYTTETAEASAEEAVEEWDSSGTDVADPENSAADTGAVSGAEKANDSSVVGESGTEIIRMVMLDDKIYADTGETSSIGRCGVMDFSIDSSVEQGMPCENNQSNFGYGYDGQWGMRENRIDICINGVWHVFAYQENDLEGVSLKVSASTASSIEMLVQNSSSGDIWYGEDYSVEKYDEEIDTWVAVPEKQEIAYEDVAFQVKVGETLSWSGNWSDRYGKLQAGQYRIVKKIGENGRSGSEAIHTLTAEFQVR